MDFLPRSPSYKYPQKTEYRLSQSLVICFLGIADNLFIPCLRLYFLSSRFSCNYSNWKPEKNSPWCQWSPRMDHGGWCWSVTAFQLSALCAEKWWCCFKVAQKNQVFSFEGEFAYSSWCLLCGGVFQLSKKMHLNACKYTLLYTLARVVSYNYV